MHHPRVDLGYWTKVFPIESFEKEEGPRRSRYTDAGDPLDLWKAYGTVITSPADLCVTELVRKRVAARCDLGRAVPVDIFLWSVAPPKRPYLTKLGGTPHREASKPWPRTADGEPFTFVAQFCFLDSKSIVSEKLPGDVMLVFFANAGAWYGAQHDIHIEWSRRELERPLVASDCPSPSFTVPQLSGVVHRAEEYPEGDVCFINEGHFQFWRFATTQSTKIGRETGFIQNDHRGNCIELLCVLNSLEPREVWPFVDLDRLPAETRDAETPYGWGRHRMTFGDEGCIYFLIGEAGEVTWASESH